ncbi:hypothetical protein [Jatrophihabitans endophyticus]|uniref:hypothetical protein n=1 Tax=Jatrophihabitans endophyticus TaxID=1206085 RepID=UPI001F288FD7|nr:hypothetical protein [Jatrophihabitans endophyticus]
MAGVLVTGVLVAGVRPTGVLVAGVLVAGVRPTGVRGAAPVVVSGDGAPPSAARQ